MVEGEDSMLRSPVLSEEGSWTMRLGEEVAMDRDYLGMVIYFRRLAGFSSFMHLCAKHDS